MCVGYQACALTAAARGYTVPLTITANFLSTSRQGDVAASVTVVRASRSFCHLTARLTQGGSVLLLVQALFRNAASIPTANVARERFVIDALRAPRIAPPAACPEFWSLLQLPGVSSNGDRSPFSSKLEIRVDAGWEGLGARLEAARAEPTDAPVDAVARELITHGWIRRTDRRRPDYLALVFFADAVIPLNGFVLRVRTADPRWHATLSITIHFHKVRSSGIA
jgi:acyl-CoA thioesterase